MFIVNIVMVLLSLVFSSIPILFYIWFVWWLDHHDREPFLLIAVAFFWGAVASIVISIAAEVVLSLPLLLFSQAIQNTVSYVVLAPLVEELAKSLILFALFFHRRFNRILDGIVYGAVVGFGFAASENLMYYVSTYFTQGIGVWVVVVVLRTVFTSVGHAVFTSITGAGVGLMKFARQKWMRFVFPPLAILMAVTLHSIFNLGAVLTEFYGLMFFLISMVVIFLSLVVVGVAMFLALHDEENCIKTQLADEIKKGVVTEMEYGILPSYLSRRRAPFRVLKEFGYREYRIASRLLELELDLAFAKDRYVNTADVKESKDHLKQVNELRSSIQKTRRDLGDAAGLLK